MGANYPAHPGTAVPAQFCGELLVTVAPLRVTVLPTSLKMPPWASDVLFVMRLAASKVIVPTLKTPPPLAPALLPLISVPVMVHEPPSF
jgi:hypothetical protein